MQVQTLPSLRPIPRTLAPHREQPPDPPEPPDPELGEQIARWVGRGSQAIAMMPQFLEARPWVLQPAGLEAVAVAAGTVGSLSLATAGVLEVVDGVHHKNGAEILKGASEVARGAFVGSFTSSLLLHQDLQWTRPLGVASGLLQTAGGLARLTQNRKPGQSVNPKVVGLLEAGMGASWLASLAGVPAGLCLAVRMGLATGKTLYTQRQKWQDWTLPK